VKYGKLDNIEGVDFTLPEDHKKTKTVLNGKSPIPLILQGGTMWNIPEWVGKIYPLKTPKKDFLNAYAQQFSTIELNATHYRTPTKETVRSWVDVVPVSFQFCPKFPQSISHYRRFKNCDQVTDDFLTVVLEMGNHLSTSFIQLPPNYKSDKSDELITYLASLPRDFKVAIEFRHESWFDENAQAEEVWSALVELGIGSVMSDTAGRRDAVHMRLTTPNCIVRFGGNNMDATDETRLNDWVDRIASWQKMGLQEFQLWMHQTNSIVTPETCIYFSKEVKSKLGIDVKRPFLYSNQQELF